MLKSRWESELLSRNGKPKRKLTPEAWFAYCAQGWRRFPSWPS